MLRIIAVGSTSTKQAKYNNLSENGLPGRQNWSNAIHTDYVRMHHDNSKNKIILQFHTINKGVKLISLNPDNLSTNKWLWVGRKIIINIIDTVKKLNYYLKSS